MDTPISNTNKTTTCKKCGKIIPYPVNILHVEDKNTHDEYILFLCDNCAKNISNDSQYIIKKVW